MDKALLDYEVSIDADCKLATVGKPFAIEGKQAILRVFRLCFGQVKVYICCFCLGDFLSNCRVTVEKDECFTVGALIQHHYYQNGD